MNHPDQTLGSFAALCERMRMLLRMHRLPDHRRAQRELTRRFGGEADPVGAAAAWLDSDDARPELERLRAAGSERQRLIARAHAAGIVEDDDLQLVLHRIANQGYGDRFWIGEAPALRLMVARLVVAGILTPVEPPRGSPAIRAYFAVVPESR